MTRQKTLEYVSTNTPALQTNENTPNKPVYIPSANDTPKPIVYKKPAIKFATVFANDHAVPND